MEQLEAEDSRVDAKMELETESITSKIQIPLSDCSILLERSKTTENPKSIYVVDSSASNSEDESGNSHENNNNNNSHDSSNKSLKQSQKRSRSSSSSSSVRSTNNKQVKDDDYDDSWNPRTRSLRARRVQQSLNYEIKDDVDLEDSQSSDSSTGSKNKKKKGPTVDEEPAMDERCKICDDGGELMLCERCPKVYHPKCLNPPLDSVPEGDWECPYCTCEPIDGVVKKILTWKWDPEETEEYRMKYYNTPQAQRKYMALPRRLFFVQLEGKSYWHCCWVTTQQLLTFHPYIIQPMTKLDRWNTEHPPQLLFEDDDDDEDFAQGVDDGVKNGLKEKYYDQGVKPAWLKIHRVINHKERRKKDTISYSYLVKWRELSYEYATWETEETCKDPLLLPEFQKHVEIYNEFRNYFQQQDDKKDKKGKKKSKSNSYEYKHIGVSPPSPISNLKKSKFDPGQELPFIDTTQGLALHDYQLEGLNWLRFSWAKGTDTILADEMGLGKTIQAITFLYSLYKEGHCRGPFLISAPLSTVVNWEREFEKWAPDFYVVTYVGEKNCRRIIRENELTADRKASSALANVRPCKVRNKVKFHVLLTSYEFITVDSTCLQSINWEIVVVDEAHRLKNASSKFFRYLGSYKTKYKLLMTGTPLQNKLEELYHLLNFLCPSKFDNLENFQDEFSEIKQEEQVKKLHEMLGPHMLRRLKADVLKAMPSKSEFLVRVELSPMQKECYKNILTKNFEALNRDGGRKATLSMILMDLRKCCNHPYLFSGYAFEAPVVNKGQADERYELESLTKASDKFVVLRKMLKKLKEQGHRVLIFSQMTTMLDILEELMDAEHYAFERIDGTVRGSERQERIDRFNAPGCKSFVFLLSTKAGGLGINLATADTVIIYDSDWNPHNDIQALSRAHRIGQKNKVLIYRFVTRNTIEEKVAHVSKRKMMLNQLVVESSRGSKSGGGNKMSLSQQEMQTILKFGVEDLFKSDAETSGTIHYTDEVIEKLLDRSERSATSETTEEKEEQHWINDYLQSFKVANYELETGGDEKEKEEEVEKEKKTEDVPTEDPDYWSKVLKIPASGPSQSSSLLISEELGRGKRQSTYRNIRPIANDRRNKHDDDDDADSGEEYRGDDAEMEYDSDEFEDGQISQLQQQQNNLRMVMGMGIVGSNNLHLSGVPNRQRPQFKTFKAPMTFSRPTQPTIMRQNFSIANGRKVIQSHQNVASQIRHLLNKKPIYTPPNDEAIVPNFGVNNLNQKSVVDPLDGHSSSKNNPTAYWQWYQQRQAQLKAQKIAAALNGISSSTTVTSGYGGTQGRAQPPRFQINPIQQHRQYQQQQFRFQQQQHVKNYGATTVSSSSPSASSSSSVSGVNRQTILSSRPSSTINIDYGDPLVEEVEPMDPLAINDDDGMEVSSSTDWGDDDPMAIAGPSKASNTNPHAGIKKLKIAFGDVGLRILGVEDEEEEDCVVID